MQLYKSVVLELQLQHSAAVADLSIPPLPNRALVLQTAKMEFDTTVHVSTYSVLRLLDRDRDYCNRDTSHRKERSRMQLEPSALLWAPRHREDRSRLETLRKMNTQRRRCRCKSYRAIADGLVSDAFDQFAENLSSISVARQ